MKPILEGFRFKKSLWRSERIFGYLLLIPAIALYTLLVVSPIARTIILSLHRWNGFDPVKTYVGLSNFIEGFSNLRLARAYWNNVVWSVLSVIPIVLGLILAVLLYQKRLIGRTFLRVCYFLPHTLSLVITGIIWRWIYHPGWGALNKALSWIGLKHLTRAWLGDPSTVLVALVSVGSWTYFGFCMVIFLSALQSIPVETYDAAKVDGATNIQQFFYITIPQLRNQITMLIILTTIWSFKVFALVLVMTRGTPYGKSEVMGFLVYVQAFQLQRVGQAAATSIVLAITIIIGSTIFLRLTEKD